MDGVALVGAIRADTKASTLPIVLMSARAGEDAVVGGLETGADDYLVKPFTARELLARVQSLLNMARMRREWAAQLEFANHELEAFSYSVAHDLRAPLRAIDGFSLVLEEDCAPQLDAHGRDCIVRIRTAVLRMSQLIDGLLDLARVSRGDLSWGQVDLATAARTIGARLRESAPMRDVELVVHDGLDVRGDARLLTAVLENLIGNAWKFTSKVPHARIEVGVRGADGERVFFVSDNGAGFQASYAHKLFGVFQRLHSVAEFEGTGIGLATVQRIVRRHGGRVWAEGEVGRGATFFFKV
jgi:light-regulated signal transduction histidine kinase (bacteriophytochrome)